MEKIKISVRSLVEFILRSGDIDNRRSSLPDKEAMQLGSKLHRKIQSQMGAGYQAEVPLRWEVETEKYTLVIEGRADGILKDGDDVLIDEIKGVFKELIFLDEPVPVHLAQAKCYAFIYGTQQNLSDLKVQMTYCNLETEEIRRFVQDYTMEELTEWFEGLVKSYQKWCEFQVDWKAERQESIKQVEFPFPYRTGQRDLAASVYRTIYHRKKLFIQAPTGVGKTISTVFPALKAVGEGLGEKIFYLTAKTITRTVAAEAFALLAQQGLQYKVITLTAKEKICACEETECNPEACPYAKGHYDRVNDAVYDMVTNQMDFSREALTAQSEKWQVCPFELSLDVALWVDAVICDYNYVFDPRAHLKRFFGDGVKGDYLFLIDEAHNLVERGREMYSASLEKERFLELKREVKPYSRKLEKLLERCNRNMLVWKRECETYQILDSVGHFTVPLMNLCGEMEKFLEDVKSGEVRKKVLELYFEVRAFLDTYDGLDENYVIYTELMENGHFQVKLYCVDTARKLQECMDKGNSTILFSATLLPIEYYKGLLSTAPDDYAVYAQTPFQPEQKCLLIGTDVSSKYTRRGKAEYERIAAYVMRTVTQKKGNYFVFFPSYKMMKDVEECFHNINIEGIRTLCQSSGMREQEREEFLQEFEVPHEEGLVGFCVMGGIFGEGIDLKNDSLIGSLIVGTGLPQVCNEREILKNYYNGHGKDGFAYAYLFPGMNKVLQSAGRVIRTTEDRGVILLLDERFTRQQYMQLFPREWAGYELCRLDNVEQKLERFWSRSSEKTARSSEQ